MGIAAALILVLLLLPGVAFADVVTRCGASAGMSFNFPSVLTSKDQLGWQKDGVSSGSIQLVRSGAQFDVIYTDGLGTRSARAEGFDVVRVPGTEDRRYLLVAMNASSGVVEHWMFDLDSSGRGQVAWGTIRGGALFPKSSLMVAACKGPS